MQTGEEKRWGACGRQGPHRRVPHFSPQKTTFEKKKMEKINENSNDMGSYDGAG